MLKSKDVENFRLLRKLQHYCDVLQMDISEPARQIYINELKEVWAELKEQYDKGEELTFIGNYQFMLYSQDQLKTLYSALIISYRQGDKSVINKINSIKELLNIEHGPKQ